MEAAIGILQTSNSSLEKYSKTSNKKPYKKIRRSFTETPKPVKN